MKKKELPPRDPQLVFHPERDTRYVHFEDSARHPFIADATTVVWRNAWWLADAALLAYWDIDVAASRLRGAGMQSEALNANGLQGYLSWGERFVIVAFRGTQPDEWKDIFVDADFPLERQPDGTRVHRGFKNSLDGIWPALLPRLTDLARTRSVWFTGHSLGAALAVLAADRYEGRSCVSTLGCPRVGDVAFAHSFDARFGERSARHVNDADIVTHVPPPLLGGYEHVDALRHIDADGNVTASAPPIPHFFDHIFGKALHMLQVVEAMLKGAITIAPDALLDHMPRAYAVHIWNDYVDHP